MSDEIESSTSSKPVYYRSPEECTAIPPRLESIPPLPPQMPLPMPPVPSVPPAMPMTSLPPGGAGGAPMSQGSCQNPSGCCGQCPARSGSGVWRNLGCFGCSTMLVLFLAFISFLIYAGSESTNLVPTALSGNMFAEDQIAVIRVEGTIMSNYGFINSQIDAVKKNKNVRAIVLRINSPGGTVSSSDYYYHRLTQLRKEADLPIVVSMGGICASGGYYVAMSAGNETENVLFAEPTSWVGSIGVIISHYDLSALAEKVGIQEDPIKSHELKGMGGMTRPLTEKEREILQALVTDSFGRFKEVVYSGRKSFAENPEALDPLATGEVFTTTRAQESGLIDSVGYLDDAIDRACELSCVDRDEAYIYTFAPATSLSSLLNATSDKMEEDALSVLEKLASPQACYLWTGR